MLHHQSCTRCRDKKIRCDGDQPCSACVRHSCSDQCQRALRKVRSRKPPAASSSVGGKVSISAAHPRSSGNVESRRPTHRIHEPLQSRRCRSKDRARSGGPRRSQGLGTAVSPRPVGFASSPSSSTGSSATSTAHDDGPHAGRSSSTGGSSISAAQPAEDLPDKARRVIGDHDAAQYVLDYIHHWRCSSMVYGCVHLPTLKASLRRLYSSSSGGQDVSEDEIALVLIALAMAIQFTPRGASEPDQMGVCRRMGNDMSPIQRQQALHALAASILRAAVFRSDVTLQQLQACILVIIYDLDTEGFKDQLLLHAMRCAETLRTDHIDDSAPITVENEMKVRCWWFLVCRDWFTASKKGSYRIHPTHFSTRLPLIVSDQTLSEAQPDTVLSAFQEPSLAWLPVRWTIPLISLARLIRQLADVKLGKYEGGSLPFHEVEEGFSQLVESLPSGFRLDETYTLPQPSSVAPTPCQQRYSIERWLLHQAIFAALLDFYEVRLGEPVSSQVVALSNHILDLQSRLRHRCDVVDSLRVNVDGIVRAVALICTDLMQMRRDAGAGLVRQVTLGRVREAIVRCHARLPATKADLQFVATLLDAEERSWRQHRVGCGGSGSASSGGTTGEPFTPASTGNDGTAATSISQSFWPVVGGTSTLLDVSAPINAGSEMPAGLDSLEASANLGLFPSDTGICPAFHPDSNVVDRLWEDVMAFLDQPLPM